MEISYHPRVLHKMVIELADMSPGLMWDRPIGMSTRDLAHMSKYVCSTGEAIRGRISHKELDPLD